MRFMPFSSDSSYKLSAALIGLFCLTGVALAQGYDPATTDTDGDGLVDMMDLDDDNDGILDTNECVSPDPDNLSISDPVNDQISSYPAVGTLTFDIVNDTTSEVVGTIVWSYSGITNHPNKILSGVGADGLFGINVVYRAGNAAYSYSISSSTSLDLVHKLQGAALGGASAPGRTETGRFIYTWSGDGPPEVILNDDLTTSGSDTDGGSRYTNATGTLVQVGDIFDQGEVIYRLANGVSTLLNVNLPLPAGESLTINSLDGGLVNESVGYAFPMDDLYLSDPTKCDTDGDGFPDHRDLDSDNDGIPDNIEGQSTLGYIAPSGVDADNDGLDDAYETTDDEGIIPVDTDGDGTADVKDLDSDNDGLWDIAESGAGLTDADNDGRTDGAVGNNGLDDTLDAADDYADSSIRGIYDATQADNFTDTDLDVNDTGGDVDYRDVAVFDRSDAPADGGTAPDGTSTTAYGEVLAAVLSGLSLGANVDDDAASIASADATGDGADDDGVTVDVGGTATGLQDQTITGGIEQQFTVAVSGTGYLSVWGDWDGNGMFDAGEQIVTDLQDDGTGDEDATAGTITFTATPPNPAADLTTFMRFRWSSATGATATSAAAGEVEDYQISFASSYEFGDAPSGYGDASHLYDADLRLGDSVDADVASIANADATGDGVDDDGVTIAGGSLQDATLATTHTLDIAVTGTGYLHGWIDWDGDGTFDADEQVATNVTDGGVDDDNPAAGVISISVRVPLSAVDGESFARFRWSSAMDEDADSASSATGEVEDYRVTINNKALNCVFVPSSSATSSSQFSASGPDNTLEDDVAVITDTHPASTLTNTFLWLQPDTTGWIEYQMGGNASISGVALWNALAPWGAGDGSMKDFTVEVHHRDGITTTSTLTVPAPPLDGTLVPGQYVDFGGNYYDVTMIRVNVLSGWYDARDDGTGTGLVDTAEHVAAGNTIHSTYNMTLAEFRACAAEPVDDYSDTPDDGETAPDGSSTTAYGLAQAGASDAMKLGTVIDPEIALIGNADATGDGADDDGVTIDVGGTATGLQGQSIPGLVATTYDVAVTGSGYLSVWADWDGNGVFDAGEKIATDLQDGGTGDTNADPNIISFTAAPPNPAADLTTFMRFRWSGEADVGPDGYTPSGEIEDYQVTLAKTDMDFSDLPANGSDAPDGTNTTSYGAAVHTVVTGQSIGATNDIDTASIASTDATGEGAEDDGVFFGPVAGAVGLQGQTFYGGVSQLLEIEVNETTAGDNYLQAWVDWNRDGDFADDGEQIITDAQDDGTGDDTAADDGVIQVSITPPATSMTTGLTFARFRWSSTAGLDATSFVVGGEVEDYQVTGLPQADVELTLTSDTDEPIVGVPVTFTITIDNLGPSPAIDLETTSLLPDGYVFVSATPSVGTYDNTTGLWDVGTMADQAQETLEIVAIPLLSSDSATEHLVIAEISAMTNIDADARAGTGSDNGIEVDDLSDGIADDDEASLDATASVGSGTDLGAQNCPAGVVSLDWDAEGGLTASGDTFTIDGKTVTVTLGGSGTAAMSFVSGTEVEISGTLPAVTDTTTITFAFDSAVEELRIPVADIDGTIEKLSVSAVSGSFGVAHLIEAGALVSVAESAAHGVGGDQSGADAQVTLGFAAPVTSVTLTLATPVPTQSDADIFVGDLSFCAQERDTVFRFAPDRTSTAQPNEAVIYEHILDVGDDWDGSALSFTTVSDQGVGWQILQDDGDGVLDSDDMVWTNGDTINSGLGQIFWVHTILPSNITSDWRDVTTVTARLDLNGESITDTVTDVTLIAGSSPGGSDSGEITGEKLIALDADCDGVADVSFSKQVAEVEPGQCATYRITYQNTGTGTVTEVVVEDATPNWTRYLGGSARYIDTPNGLTEGTITAPISDDTGPVTFPFTGGLAPGASGAVEFTVRLD